MNIGTDSSSSMMRRDIGSDYKVLTVAGRGRMLDAATATYNVGLVRE